MTRTASWLLLASLLPLSCTCASSKAPSDPDAAAASAVVSDAGAASVVDSDAGAGDAGLTGVVQADVPPAAGFIDPNPDNMVMHRVFSLGSGGVDFGSPFAAAAADLTPTNVKAGADALEKELTADVARLEAAAKSTP